MRWTSRRPSTSKPSPIVAAPTATPNASQRGETAAVAVGQMNVLATTNAPARPMPVWPSQCSHERMVPLISMPRRRIAAKVSPDPLSSSWCTTCSTVVSCSASARRDSANSARPPPKAIHSAVGVVNARVAMTVEAATRALIALRPEKAWLSRRSATRTAARDKTTAATATPNAIHTALVGAKANRSMAMKAPPMATAKVMCPVAHVSHGYLRLKVNTGQVLSTCYSSGQRCPVAPTQGAAERYRDRRRGAVSGGS